MICTTSLFATSYLPTAFAPVPYLYLTNISKTFTPPEGYKFSTIPIASVWSCYKGGQECGINGDPYVIKMEGHLNKLDAMPTGFTEISFFVLLEKFGQDEFIMTFRGDIDSPAVTFRVMIYNLFRGLDRKEESKPWLQEYNADANFKSAVVNQVLIKHPGARHASVLEAYSFWKAGEVQETVASLVSITNNYRQIFVMLETDSNALLKSLTQYKEKAWPQLSEFRLPIWKPQLSANEIAMIEIEIRMAYLNYINFTLIRVGALENVSPATNVDVFLFERKKDVATPSGIHLEGEQSRLLNSEGSSGATDNSLGRFLLFATRHTYYGKSLPIVAENLFEVSLGAMVWTKCKHMKKLGESELLKGVEKQHEKIIEALRSLKMPKLGGNDQTLVLPQSLKLSKSTPICYGLLTTSDDNTEKTYIFLHESNEIFYAVSATQAEKLSVEVQGANRVCYSMESLLQTLNPSFRHPNWIETYGILEWYDNFGEKGSMSEKHLNALIRDSEKGIRSEGSMLDRLIYVYDDPKLTLYQILQSKRLIGKLKFKCDVKIEFIIFGVQFTHSKLPNTYINDFVMITIRQQKGEPDSCNLANIIAKTRNLLKDEAGKLAYDHLVKHEKNGL